MDEDFLAMLRPLLRYLNDEPIARDDRLRDLGLDSMREIELLFAIEDTYDIVLPDEVLTDTTFSTAGQLWAVIAKLSGQRDAEIR